MRVERLWAAQIGALCGFGHVRTLFPTLAPVPTKSVRTCPYPQEQRPYPVPHRTLYHPQSSDLERGAGHCSTSSIVFAIRAALRRACLRVAFSSPARSALSDQAPPRPLLVGDLRSPRANRRCLIRISGPGRSRASSEDRSASRHAQDHDDWHSWLAQPVARHRYLLSLRGSSPNIGEGSRAGRSLRAGTGTSGSCGLLWVRTSAKAPPACVRAVAATAMQSKAYRLVRAPDHEVVDGREIGYAAKSPPLSWKWRSSRTACAVGTMALKLMESTQ
jgi:hypothetical protein